MSEYKHLYKEHDKSFVVNDNDKDLTPIRISLPSPPDLELIDGYGKHPDNQYFRRLKPPSSLVILQDRVYRELKEESERNHNNRINGYTITKRFWDIIYDDIDNYQQELKFINDFWYYTIYGYWFYNDGKPTYITGRYFHFLNTWFMPEEQNSEGNGYLRYKDKDRRKYLFKEYLYNTGETFIDKDKDTNKAVKKGLEYRIKNLAKKLFFGIVEPKTRRSGATMQGCHDIWYENTIMKRGAFGTIVSMDGDNAGVHFKKKFIPYWQNLPLWEKPIWQGNNSPSTLMLFPPRTEYEDNYIGSIISYTKSSKETKNDGDKINSALFDEEGKSYNVNVLERWNINKLAMSLGGGSIIRGWCTHPSTVEDITEKGMEYKKLCSMSDFYDRIDNGQTASGLSLVFFSSYEGLDGFIDRFGQSVIDTPTERQMRLSPNEEFSLYGIGAKEYIDNKLNDLLRRAEKDPDAISEYRSTIRKMPTCYAQCWLGATGGSGMPVEEIDKRLIQLNRAYENGEVKAVQGRFEEIGSSVEFKPDPEGKWTVSKQLPRHESNLETFEAIHDSFRSLVRRHKSPANKFRFVIGVDPYTFIGSAEAKKYSRTDKRSNGSISVFWREEEYDKNIESENMESYRFVATLNYRFENDEILAHEALKAARYYGAMVYHERNRSNIEQVFMQQGYGGYLLYDVDKDGKKAKDSGRSMQKDAKIELFREQSNYLEFRACGEYHDDYLQEAKEINSIDQMTNYDLFTSTGIALLGNKVLDKYKAQPHLGNRKSVELNMKAISAIL